MVQTARLRRAWNAVSLYYHQSEQDRSRVSVEDLDALLADGELRETKVAFWRRYRLRFPPKVHPSDSTVSRVSREIAKRMLCVFNVWKVRSLQFQLTTVQRKRKLAEGLYTEETNEEEPIFQDWEGYLNKLHTLMVAYSMAGTAATQGSPDIQLEKTLGAESTQLVQVPLDVATQYYTTALSGRQGLCRRLGV